MCVKHMSASQNLITITICITQWQLNNSGMSITNVSLTPGNLFTNSDEILISEKIKYANLALDLLPSLPGMIFRWFSRETNL